MSGAAYGWAVAGGIDLNGDGLSEILVSDPMYSTTGDGSYWGLVEVIDLNLLATPFLRGSVTGMAPWEQFGDDLCTIGDQNGDGFDEVLIGATRFFLGGVVGTAPGIARIYDGISLSTPAATPNLISTLNGNWAGDTFGYSVANVGDLTGDGRPDYMVGAPDFGYLGGMNNEGYASFYANGAPPTAGWNYMEPRAQVNRGLDADGLYGDVDGDGFMDILVGGGASFGSFPTNGQTYGKVISGRSGAVLQILRAKGSTHTMGWAVCGLGKFVGTKPIPRMAVADPAAARVHIY